MQDLNTETVVAGGGIVTMIAGWATTAFLGGRKWQRVLDSIEAETKANASFRESVKDAMETHRRESRESTQRIHDRIDRVDGRIDAVLQANAGRASV